MTPEKYDRGGWLPREIGVLYCPRVEPVFTASDVAKIRARFKEDG